MKYRFNVRGVNFRDSVNYEGESLFDAVQNWHIDYNRHGARILGDDGTETNFIVATSPPGEDMVSRIFERRIIRGSAELSKQRDLRWAAEKLRVPVEMLSGPFEDVEEHWV